MKKILYGLLGIVVLAAGGLGVFYWYAARGLAPAMLEEKYLTDADRFITVDGARVRVREEGPEHAPPLVLLHGFTYSLETWDAWAAALSEDYRVIRYDLLGHGLTGPDSKERYAPQARARFLAALMDALDLQRAALAGNSLGGLVAWRFAAAFPDRVDALILLDAPAYPYNGVGDTPASVPPAVKMFLKTAPKSAVRKSAELVWADDAKIPDARLELLRDMMRRRGNGEAFVRHISVFTMPDPSAHLAAIAAPTLLQWGGADLLVSLDHGAKMEQAIANARLVVYDGVGHAPQEEAASETVADARRFLAQYVKERVAGADGENESAGLNE